MTRLLSALSKTAFGGRRSADFAQLALSATGRAFSGRVGLEWLRSAPAGHPGRPITLMLEFYDGPSPYGQFFHDDISYAGVGLHFGL